MHRFTKKIAIISKGEANTMIKTIGGRLKDINRQQFVGYDERSECEGNEAY